MMGEAHPHDPHAYLFVLGTRPERQAQGFGSALIRHVTERLTATASPPTWRPPARTTGGSTPATDSPTSA